MNNNLSEDDMVMYLMLCGWTLERNYKGEVLGYYPPNSLSEWWKYPDNAFERQKELEQEISNV